MELGSRHQLLELGARFHEGRADGVAGLNRRNRASSDFEALFGSLPGPRNLYRNL